MQKYNLNRMEYFVAIAEEGTITAAARRMRISKAVVSKQLLQLEEDLGTALVVRNPRHLSLTDAGQQFYEAAKTTVERAKEAFDSVKLGTSEPSGDLRITAPLDFGVAYVAQALVSFNRAYPQVTPHLDLTDTKLDPVRSRYDIGLRVGWLDDSSNIARKLGEFRQIPVAAPALLDSFGRPKHPKDLCDMPFIEHQALATPTRWTFEHAVKAPVNVEFEPRLGACVTLAITAMAKSGGGFCIVPDFAVEPQLETGELERVLEDWTLPTGGIYAVFPPLRFRPAATRKFTDLLIARLAKDRA
ncbi:LysR family transcriptional regulator [Chelativorans salis]|uniref:LysR family transcriptional regulator n=1 Tax=Chelativorans salis TaxID=2978478 RepID=A0ABT2LGV8_9HYPH|nr:LysR family transcriptional regulator [Chelativorans sp. EGI FJ00035]MCT7373765.1 LysR family transcriptional regulator [Chelativorans sp. EGI FJ00035]